jgi:DHA2 family multidrug resistance protein
MILFSIFTLWGYFIVTPDTDSDAFFWMLIVRGLGMGMLFIPITALLPVDIERTADRPGSSVYRNDAPIRRFFGVALITTFMAAKI